MNLTTPMSEIAGVGPVYVKRLERLGIIIVQDLLNHYPFRYEDYRHNTPAAQAKIGETVTVRGAIHAAQNDYTKSGKQMQKIQLFDGTGSIMLVFFNQPYLISTMKQGMEIAASGEVRFFGRNKAIIGPEYELIYKREPIHTGRLVPVYPETAGLSSKWIRSKIALILNRMPVLDEYLPNHVVVENNLLDYDTAIRTIHFPESVELLMQTRERLGFDELFTTFLASRIRKEEWHTEKATYQLQTTDYRTQISEFIRNLPFTLTPAQSRCVDEILADMSNPEPMNRLLQGDVGSGKTVVAAIAMYASYLNGYSSVIMAPTEILAEQHCKTIQKLFGPHGISVDLVTGSRRKKQPQTSSQQSTITIGTHALLYNREFHNLALVVIDEQHRFGVEQRAKLKQQGIHPHLLSMTATPIPRSYALVLHSELNLSYIDEMPVGRKQIKTWLVPNKKREKAYEWIRSELRNTKHEIRNQAFIICPLIEESDHETMQSVKSAKKEFDHLQKHVFPDLQLALIHGKMKQKEKETVLTAMAAGDVDILVATPVVEVGIDIPDATIMVIEAAERFGLAQLHQLRGRVGRSDKQSYCLLFTQSTSDQAHARLKYLETIHTGAQLAEVDMKLRGAGDLFGTRQSGFSDFKLASLTDTPLITKVQDAVKTITIDAISPRLQERLQKYIIRTVNPD